MGPRNLAIATVAFNRPDYLQIFLHGLSLVKGIEEYPIFIYFDYLPSDGMKQQHLDVINRFSQAKAKSANFHGKSRLDIRPIFRERRHGVLFNVTYSYRDTFAQGFGEVLMFETDIIMRTDILEYLDSIPRDAFFYNLMGNVTALVSLYRAFGNLLERDKFSILYKWIEEKQYVGRLNIRETAVLVEKSGHDAVYSRFLVDHNLKTRFSPLFYVAHVGVKGIHITPRNKEERAVEEAMFKGPYYCWFGQAVKIIERELYPKSLETTLKPKGFKYA